MTRDEIVAKLRVVLPDMSAAYYVADVLAAIERAGLTIIPREPTEQEIERVAVKIVEICDQYEGTDYLDWKGVARAAASAVREQDEQRGGE